MREVAEFFRSFFNTGNWPPRWQCGKWSDFHGWLYIISDLAIWAAYFTIPFLLIHFIIRKKDVPFPKVFWLFGTFILACGTTHLIDAIIFWVPIYRISAIVRFFTAIVSWGTIVMLYRILPNAFSLKTPAELERLVNERTEELHLSIEKTKFLADAMPQIVWNAGPDGSIEYVNTQALKFTGKSVDDLSGWNWTDILHPDDQEDFINKWKHSLDNILEFECESRIAAANGIYYWHLTRALPHSDENGNILLWVGTATDIELQKRQAEMLEREVAERTEQLRNANTDLIQSNDDLEHFAAVASHDLQAPLRTISTYLGMLAEKNSHVLDEQSLRYISRSLEVGGRMKNLIENLLAFSKINAEKGDLRSVDLNEIMGTVLANLTDLIDARGVAVACAELPVIYADEVQMGQLLQNLISNAINHNTDDTPTVSVESTESDQEHTISVTDNGPGIDESNLQKVFDVFTRLQSATQGSGLGLAICKKIVDKHGGRIWAESEKGKGSTFFFTVPKVKL
ncbi:MAG TPA: ATP-binding protein [Flavobacterium sp.]|jgi:PAS domain S-box-containing protein